ncbi:MAG: aminotransferase class I/II-fold pyridoxal phosphate-dependent enzyme [Planctomycetes bacterium]|nr:aminotransferase class I/II-fold pyridoxal phosphate-dependent enzyme [Planctomycetota bacterium]
MNVRAPVTVRPSFLIPDCVERPADDPIFALNAEASKRRAAGEKVVNATLGALMDDSGELAVMPSVFAALARVPQKRGAGYAPIAGVPRFLELVIRDLYGASALAEQSVAVATPGGTGALHHAIVNFLEPGQALLTTDFYWGPYKTLAEHTRRRVETFSMFDARGRFDAAAFERALEAQLARQGRALVILNTPCHNPTGYALDEREWQDIERVVKSASTRGAVALCIDFAYARFAPGSADAWVKHAERLAGDALILVAYTVSKSFTQYGARVGALVATHPSELERKRIFAALSFSCRGTWSNCNHAGQLAVAELLGDPVQRAAADAERDVLRNLLFQRVQAFNAAAAKSGLAYPRYEGGFFVTVFCRDGERVAERMRGDGVFVVPLAGGVRVALCSTPAADVPRLVESLARAVAAESRP